MAAPKVGDRFMCRGHLHEIIRLNTRARMVGGVSEKVTVAVYENGTRRSGYRGKVLVETMEWSEQDRAWYQAGRVLARNECAVAAAITRSWPDPDSHMAMRSMLDAVDLDDVNMGRLAEVVGRKKVDCVQAAIAAVVERSADPEAVARQIRKTGLPAKGPDRDTYNAVCAEYAVAAIAQCKALREKRPAVTEVFLDLSRTKAREVTHG